MKAFNRPSAVGIFQAVSWHPDMSADVKSSLFRCIGNMCTHISCLDKYLEYVYSYFLFCFEKSCKFSSASGQIRTFGWSDLSQSFDRHASSMVQLPSDLALAPILKLCSGYHYSVALFPRGRTVIVGRPDLPLYRGLKAIEGVDVVDIVFGPDYFLALTGALENLDELKISL